MTRPLALALLMSAGCHPKPVAPFSPVELSTLEDVASASPEAHKHVMLANGLGAATYTPAYQDSTCAQVFEAWATASPATKLERVADASADCALLCGFGEPNAALVDTVLATPVGDRTMALVQACDALGPDPVFGGEWAAFRGQMDVVDYWVGRAAFTGVFTTLAAETTPEATLLRQRYDVLRDRIATRSVLSWPPSDSHLPISHSARRVDSAPLVRVTADHTALGGSAWPHGDTASAPLTEAPVQAHHAHKAQLATWVESSGRKVPEGFAWPTTERLLVQADDDVTMAQLRPVLAAAQAVAPTEVELAALNPQLGQRFLPLTPPHTHEMLEATGTRLMVHLTPDSVVVQPADEPATTLPCGATGCEGEAAMSGLVTWLNDRLDLGTDFGVIVSADDAVTTQALVRALDACRTAELDGEWVPFLSDVSVEL